MSDWCDLSHQKRRRSF